MSESRALYQIAEEFAKLKRWAEDPDQDMESLEMALTEVAGDLERKTVGAAAVAQQIRAQAEYFRAKAAEVLAYAKSLERKSERIEEYLLEQMRIAGVSLMEDAVYPVRVAESTYAEITELENLPESCWRIKINEEPDKALILRHLRAGEDVPGAKLGRRQYLKIGRRFKQDK